MSTKCTLLSMPYCKRRRTARLKANGVKSQVDGKDSHYVLKYENCGWQVRVHSWNDSPLHHMLTRSTDTNEGNSRSATVLSPRTAAMTSPQ